MRIAAKTAVCAALLGSIVWTAHVSAADDPKKPAAGAKSDAKDAAAKPAKDAPMTVERATSPLDFTVKDIDDKDAPLSRYKGSVVLIVNVASKCGFTPQYSQLESIYEKYKDRGFVILGFPANEFGAQEPGTNNEIKQFCTEKFNVKFPMFAKVVVKGDGIVDLYRYLTSTEKVGADKAGDIKWNFTKFLVGRDGKVIARFEPKTKPDDAAVTAEIEKALGAGKSEK